jgi:hypothetical protein
MSSVTTLPKKVETYDDIVAVLGQEAEYLLAHECKTIPKEQLHLPGPDFVDRVWVHSDRNPQVLRNLQTLFLAWTLRGDGISLYLAGGSRGRALRRCLLRPQSHLL